MVLADFSKIIHLSPIINNLISKFEKVQNFIQNNILKKV